MISRSSGSYMVTSGSSGSRSHMSDVVANRYGSDIASIFPEALGEPVEISRE